MSRQILPEEGYYRLLSLTLGVYYDGLKEALNTLSIREKQALQLRFGLEDGELRTYEEVGIHLKVSKERVRQIEAKAIRKLKHPTRIKMILSDYYFKNKQEQIEILKNTLKLANEKIKLLRGKFNDKYTLLKTIQPIERLTLPVRIENALKALDITSIGELLKYPINKLEQGKNLGKKSTQLIQENLNNYLTDSTEPDKFIQLHHSLLKLGK